MFIQGNLRGFLMFVAAAIVIALGYFVLKTPDAITMIAGGVTLIGIDLFLRILKTKEQNWLFRKDIGGYLYFAPVWVFGFAVIVINVIQYFVKK